MAKRQILCATAEERREKRAYREGVKAGRNQSIALDWVVIVVCCITMGFAGM